MKARKLPSGRWNVQVLDYIDESGKKHTRSFTADTKAQADKLNTYIDMQFRAE